MKTEAVVMVVVAGTENSGGRHLHRGAREVGAPGSTAPGRPTNHTPEMTRDKVRVALLEDRRKGSEEMRTEGIDK